MHLSSHSWRLLTSIGNKQHKIQRCSFANQEATYLFLHRYIDARGSPQIGKKNYIAHSPVFTFYLNASFVQDFETLISWKILFLSQENQNISLHICFYPKQLPSPPFSLSPPSHLWGLVVHGKNCNIEANPMQSASMLIADRKNKLDLLGFRSNVLQGWHVSNFHIVHSMLQKRKGVHVRGDNGSIHNP